MTETGSRAALPHMASHDLRAGKDAQARAARAGRTILWVAGIVVDAERDARSHQPGAIRDVALVGAVRKAKAAKIVSGETALALTRGEGLPAIVAAAEANMAEEVEADRRLRERLGVLASFRTPPSP